MLTILVGKTFSGKSTYIKNHPELNQVKTHTTRPVRPTENGDEYFFDTVEEYTDKIHNNITVADRRYMTIYGNWYYWTEIKDILSTENPVLILDLKGVKELMSYMNKNYVNIPFKVIYLNTPLHEIWLRIESSPRGISEDKEESLRRIFDDVDKHRILDSIVGKKRLCDITLLLVSNRV